MDGSPSMHVLSLFAFNALLNCCFSVRIGLCIDLSKEPLKTANANQQHLSDSIRIRAANVAIFFRDDTVSLFHSKNVERNLRPSIKCVCDSCFESNKNQNNSNLIRSLIRTKHMFRLK